MEKPPRSSFVSVAKEAKGAKINLKGNVSYGSRDFFADHGENTEANIEDNLHIYATPNRIKPLVAAIKKPSANGYKGLKIIVIGALLTFVLGVVGMAVYDFYVKPTLSRTLEQPLKTEVTKE